MYRRDSRGYISNIQEDTLLEFENYKKKFLLANRHITKLNSTLSVRVEELNGQLSSLYAENLRLRASEIALATQLKREKEKSYKIMLDTETATMNLLKQLGIIRQSFKLDAHQHIVLQPPSPLSPKAKQPTPRSPAQPRLAQPPSIPGISEDPEPPQSSCDEFDRKAKKPQQLRETSTFARVDNSASRLPLPSRVSSPPLVDETSRHSPSMNQVLAKKKKPLRRHSGLLSVSVENLPRPCSPALNSPINKTLDMFADTERFNLDGQSEIDLHTKNEEQEEMAKRMKKKIKAREREATKNATFDKENIKTTKDSDSGEDKLRDVTNSSRRRISSQFGDINNNHEQMSGSKELPLDISNRQKVEAPISEDPHLLNIPSAPLIPSGSQGSIASDDDNGNATGRERRARKSVNYAEPKLNTKMRKPDNFQATSSGRSSLTPALQPKSSKKDPLMDDNDQIYPPLPTPPSSSSPLSQSTQIDVHEALSQRSPSLLSSHMITATKRKKLPRPSVRPESDDDNDDGVEADAEWGDNKSSLSSNVTGRRKTCQPSKANFTNDTRVNLDRVNLDNMTEDRRRHSLAV